MLRIMKKILEIQANHFAGIKYNDCRNTVRLHLKKYLRVTVRLHAWLIKEEIYHSSFVNLTIFEDRAKFQIEVGVLGDQGLAEPNALFHVIRYYSTTIAKKDLKNEQHNLSS